MGAYIQGELDQDDNKYTPSPEKVTHQEIVMVSDIDNEPSQSRESLISEILSLIGDDTIILNRIIHKYGELSSISTHHLEIIKGHLATVRNP